MKKSNLNNFFTRVKIPEREKEHTIVSYSQFSKYTECPRHWKLRYIDKIKDPPNIHLVFGTAMHETIQEWLNVMYTESLQKANEMDLNKFLKESLKKEYETLKERHGSHFSNPNEMNEFFIDGIKILNFLKEKRTTYFSTRKVKLLAIELPVYIKPIEEYDVYMTCYLDLVFADLSTRDILIIDIKTSTKGWNKYQKADKTKISQLPLYKKYLSVQYGIPLDRIKVEYFIVKRKLNEDVVYPQKRVQTFVPPNSTRTVNSITGKFEDFIKEAYNKDGSYNTDKYYQPVAGSRGFNCTFCPFKNDHEKCPLEERLYE